MSDDGTQAGTSDDQQQPTPNPNTPNFDGPFDEAKAQRLVENLRESERKLKEELATLRPKAAEFDKLEESKKTETQKLSEQLAVETAKREALERQALRFKVGVAKGLPAELIDRLQGETEEDLQADADKLLKLVTPEAPGVPRASRTQGAPENGSPASGSNASINEAIRRAARR